MLELNHDVEWAITEDAREAVKTLVNKYGLDADLALCLLEKIWPEDKVYNLPKDE